MRKYIKPSIIAIAIETEEILRASKPNMSIQPETGNDVYINYNRSDMMPRQTNIWDQEPQQLGE